METLQNFLGPEEIYFKLGAVLTTFVVGIYFTWKKMYQKLFSRKKIINESMLFVDLENKNMRIYEKLMYLRIKSDASRVRICLFHNGGNFLSGDPIKKFTCTHEMTSSGVSNESQRFNNSLVSIFIEKINIVKQNSPKIHVLEDLVLEESKTKYLYKATQVKKFAILPLKINDMIVGFLEVEWNEVDPNMILDGAFESFFTMVKTQIELEMMKKEKDQSE